MLIVIDEMPRIGFLKPVMDGYTMAAGKGVHFWCFAQSISALDSSWGKEHRKTLLHLAEVVQVLGFPRTDAEGAEELSKAIGTATFEGRTESKSGTVAESRIVTANTQWQASESRIPRARAPGHAGRADDAGAGSPIRDRGAQGHAARCAPPAPRPLLAEEATAVTWPTPTPSCCARKRRSGGTDGMGRRGRGRSGHGEEART